MFMNTLLRISARFTTCILFLSTLYLPPIVLADTAESIRLAQGLSSAFEDVAQSITPSVVSVSSLKRPRKIPMVRKRQADPSLEPFKDFFGEDFMEKFPFFQGPDGDGGAQQGLGTGVIVDANGYILTNNHVIGEADEITVVLSDKRKFKAEVKGRDPKSDIAVIKISASNLTPARLGDSKNLKIGQWVIACGNPFGLDNTITAGIVSAKGRSISAGGQFEDFIQTDAAINPGNSGGPLLNLNGEVVGINTAIFSRSGGYMGIGFAIPIDMAKAVMESLISKGKVVRGWLGVSIQNLTEDLSSSFGLNTTEGALVGSVSPGSPAAKAGMKQGDIVVRFNGTKILDVNQLRNLVASTPPGEKAEVEVIRDSNSVTLSVGVEELDAAKVQDEIEQEQQADSAVDLGVDLKTLTPDLAPRLGTKKTSGVIVLSVAPGSIAETAGLISRDIIISVNGKSVKNVKEFLAIVNDAALTKGVRLVVDTQGVERFVVIRSSK